MLNVKEMYVLIGTYPKSPKAPFIRYDLNVFDGSRTTISFFSLDKARPVMVSIPLSGENMYENESNEAKSVLFYEKQCCSASKNIILGMEYSESLDGALDVLLFAWTAARLTVLG